MQIENVRSRILDQVYGFGIPKLDWVSPEFAWALIELQSYVTQCTFSEIGQSAKSEIIGALSACA
jgi:hypothetical protein